MESSDLPDITFLSLFLQRHMLLLTIKCGTNPRLFLNLPPKSKEGLVEGSWNSRRVLDVPSASKLPEENPRRGSLANLPTVTLT